MESSPVVPTAFAVLFLARATREPIPTTRPRLAGADNTDDIDRGNDDARR
jgi:hypothetical protein